MATTKGATGRPRLGSSRSSEGSGIQTFHPTVLDRPLGAKAGQMVHLRLHMSKGGTSMATSWFDQLAKRSARSAPPATSDSVAGPTRRQVLARGAVVAGAAWTAPMLMGVQPAYAAQSQCTGQDIFVMCPTGPGRCCPPGQTCFEGPPGVYFCQVPLGASCGNQGFGQCNGNTSRCNQPGGNPTTNPAICGGPGAVCGPGDVCVAPIECSGLRCGGVGAACTTDAECAPATTGGVPGTICVGTAPNRTCQLAPAGGVASRRDAEPTTRAPAPTATATPTPEPPPPPTTPPATPTTPSATPTP